jgi:hypothetical protein
MAKPNKSSAKPSGATYLMAWRSPANAVSAIHPAKKSNPACGSRSRGSLGRLRLSRLDLFFLHSNVVPDKDHMARWPEAARRMTLYATFVDHVRPIFERLVGEGLIGAWGLTGIGHHDTIIKLLGERPAPAAVQCIAKVLDSRSEIRRNPRVFDAGNRFWHRFWHSFGVFAYLWLLARSPNRTNCVSGLFVRFGEQMSVDPHRKGRVGVT